MKNTRSKIHNQLLDLSLNWEQLERLMTPALAIYPDVVQSNVKVTLDLLDGNADRWQPHIKTAKLQTTIRQLYEQGVKCFKCATTLEILNACQAGAEEVLMAYPSTGNRAKRIREIALAHPSVRMCATVENAGQLAEWEGSSIALYIDINSGMNRTGIEQESIDETVALASRIQEHGFEFAGLHAYEGHNRQPELEARRAACYSAYEQLLLLIQALEGENLPVQTLITSGTPALPCALSFPGFKGKPFSHRVSSGTIVYNDLGSISQLPEEWDYRFAAVVIASVISHPAPGLITCDAGHKAVSSDAGFPNCLVLGHPELEPQHPSEEHLPIRVAPGAIVPPIGDVLYLVPKHVCTTVNNFDSALLVRGGMILEIAQVTARGRESPLFQSV